MTSGDAMDTMKTPPPSLMSSDANEKSKQIWGDIQNSRSFTVQVSIGLWRFVGSSTIPSSHCDTTLLVTQIGSSRPGRMMGHKLRISDEFGSGMESAPAMIMN